MHRSMSRQGIPQVFTPKPRTRPGLTSMADLEDIEGTQTLVTDQEREEARGRLARGFTVRLADARGTVRVLAGDPDVVFPRPPRGER